MASRSKIKVEPPVTQVVDGVTREYVIIAEYALDKRGKSTKKIKQVRAFPIDNEGRQLKDAKPLYRNGEWSKSQVTTLTEQQQADFHRKIQIATKQLAIQSNKTIPSWAQIAGSDVLEPIAPGQTPTGAASGIQGAIDGVDGLFGGSNQGTNVSSDENFFQSGQNFLKTIQSEGLFGLVKDYGLQGNKFDTNLDASLLNGYPGNILTYPQNMNPNQDALKITCFRYKPPYADALQETSIGNIKRTSPFKERLGSIKLPMPNSIVDGTSAGWEVDYMGDIQLGAAQHIAKNAFKYGSAGVVEKLNPGGLGNLVGSAAKLAVYGSMIANGDGAIKGALGANIVSMLGANLGFDIGADQILGRSGGIISNSNAELMFRGVTLRTFEFAYTLVARSYVETQAITTMIRCFKQWSAPRKLTGTEDVNQGPQAGGSSFFLGTPNIFQLQYLTGGTLNKHVNKFKPCALTSFSVNYAPGEQWMAYDQGAPVKVFLTFRFSELEPIYNTDYTQNIPEERDSSLGGLGDLTPIGLFDVGY